VRIRVRVRVVNRVKGMGFRPRLWFISSSSSRKRSEDLGLIQGSLR
jgi:hypothetical protein